MPAYLIADTDVHDPAGYEQYKALALPIAEQFGGEYLGRRGDLRVDDDDLWSPTRIVIISFPDLASAHAFVDSDEYAPAKQMRRKYSKSTIVIVDDTMPVPSRQSDYSST